MSRCFPFPPPGYSGKCSSNDALILSIKLQQEREESTHDREREKAAKSSERKKDRKEKKKKDKKRGEQRASSDVINEKQKLKEKLYQADKGRVVLNGKCVVREDESEQLEKSTVTEEHGRPALQNVTCSTDSTGNSCKRKRLSTLPSGIQSNGNIIRIRLSSSHERDEPSTSGSKEHETPVPLHRRSDRDTPYGKVQPCSNIIRTELSKSQRDVTVKAPQELSHPASRRNAVIQSVSRKEKALPCLPSQKTESVVPKEKLSSHEKKLRKRESKYNKLFESWVPFPLESMLVVDGDDSDDWLFGKKGEDRAVKRLKTGDVDSCGDSLPSCSSPALQPRSHFLADADIYALPFTMPY